MYVHVYILYISISYIHTRTDFDLGGEEDDSESEDMADDDEVCMYISIYRYI